MRNFFVVLKYTFLENVRKKAFIISTIIMLLLTIGIFNINNIADAITGKEKNDDTQQIVIMDENNVYGSILNNYKIPETNSIFINNNDEELKILKEKVTKEEIGAIVIIDESKGLPTFKYIVKDERNVVKADIVSSIIKNVFSTVTLKKFNIDDETLNNLNQPITYEVEQTNGEGPSITLYVLSIVTSLLLYFAIYFYGYSVSTSISNEKTSRVMETLVTSTKPSSIVLGKTAAMGILGLSQLLLIIITALISYKIFVGGDFVILGETIDFSTITLPMLLLLVLYFILGYMLYALLSAVTGATVSKAEDINSASMPVSFISLLSFYLGYFSLTNPTSSVNAFASFMPFSSPFTMPSRMMMMSVPAWQIVLSIVLLVVTISLFAFISVRLYSAAILYYGSKLSFKDLLKMSRNN